MSSQCVAGAILSFDAAGRIDLVSPPFQAQGNVAAWTLFGDKAQLNAEVCQVKRQFATQSRGKSTKRPSLSTVLFNTEGFGDVWGPLFAAISTRQQYPAVFPNGSSIAKLQWGPSIW